MDIQIGKTAVAATIVDKSNTALAVGSGNLEVFGTPMMIALMEKAACEALGSFLDENQTSVGISVNIEHTSASLIGAKVSATATITATSGRKVSFNLVASDDNGTIGKGAHERFVVDSKRFMDKLQK